MANQIRFKRGLKANIPVLLDGEVGWCTDTKELFIGQDGANKLVGESNFLKLSGGTLTGNLVLSGLPSQGTHAASKNYVDSVASGLDVKESVKCIITDNIFGTIVDNEIEYGETGVVTADGVVLDVEGVRVLVVGQSNYAQNGIYCVATSGSESVRCVLKRCDDFVTGTVSAGAFTFVEAGEVYGGTGWVLTCEDSPVIVGTSLLIFSQFSGAGSASFISLTDTPSSYQGSGTFVLTVSEGEDKIDFTDPSTIGRTTFLALDDTPSDYADGKLLISSGSGIGFIESKLFNGIFGDAPSSIGLAEQLLRVNAGRTAIEFFSALEAPVNASKTPISGGWAYSHSAATSGVHGAPAGKNLLHENSVIDGGSF